MSFKSVAEFLALKGDAAATTAEKNLIKATQAGNACVLCDPDNPSRPTEATDTTRIRASLLRLLITGGTPVCGLHTRGVTLFGGWIDGPLDIAYCRAKGQTILESCHFADRPSFEYADFWLLGLTRSALPKGLLAQGIQFKGSLLFLELTATGNIDVNSGKIGGQFVCNGAHFDGGMDAREIPLYALNAQGMETGKDLILRDVAAFGTVAVNGAKIGGQLDCTGARFDSRKGSQEALNAQGVETGLDLFLDYVTANGTVDLSGAKIGGQLGCVGARFCGSTDLKGNIVSALRAQRMRVGESFLFRGVTEIKGPISLASAQVGDLVDEMTSWPKGVDQLILNGLTYDRIVGPTTLSARRDWLTAGSHLRGEFLPQPFTQFARVLRQTGHAIEARSVLIERERLLAEHRIAADRAAYRKALQGDQTQRSDAGWIWLRMTGFRLWTWLTKTIAGYGYAPQRALYCSLVVVPLFALAYALFWQMGAMVPADAILLATPEWANAVAANPSAPSHSWAGPAASHYETFYSLPYALDVFLPIVDLGQQSTWSQTTVTWWGWGARVTTWILQSLGYIITSLGLAAATGIIQRNQPD